VAVLFPLLHPSPKQYAYEGARNLFQVLSITGCTDDDTGSTLTYSITSGNTNNDFAIDSSAGHITLTNG
jgi:hypothetical protein